jgi:hypothetical protein
MSAGQQTIICRVGILEAQQCEISVQTSAIEAGLPDVREFANRMERKLSELATEIQSVGSVSAAARESHSPRADEADERLIGSERGGARLLAEVEALHGRCDECTETDRGAER